MKIVQTFWSKPALDQDEESAKTYFQRGNSGGWIEQRNYYVSWALSCLQLRKFYDSVELVTDKVGKKILIDELGLPYTSVRVELDTLSGYHSDLWAIGKIYSYGIQKEPFIHVDGDIYIWQKFGIEHADLIAQNLEKGLFYNELINKFNRQFLYFPQCLHKTIESTEVVHSINAGIFGGNNWNFISEYARAALRFVDENAQALKQIEVGKFNVLFEQIFFYYLALENDLPITRLIDGTFSSYGKWIVDFDHVPGKTTFIHAIGNHKKDPDVNQKVNTLLQQEYPEYYNRIVKNFS